MTTSDSGGGLADLPGGETTRQFKPISGEAEPQVEPEAIDDPGRKTVEGLPPDTALLVVKRGPNAGSRFLLDQSVTTAGRHPSSDIFLDDVTVSRRHVEFRREGTLFTVHDVGSLNGTYLNRDPIDSAALSGGDEVQIGKFRMIFLTGHRGDQSAGQSDQ